MGIASVGLLGLVFTMQVPAPQAPGAESSALRDERRAIREREAEELKGLADRRVAAGDRAGAEAILKRIEPTPVAEGPVRFRPLPEVVPPRNAVRALANVPPKEVAERDPDELVTVRTKAAQALFQLAVRALSGATKHYSIADECLRAVLDREPDHPEARRLLGYVAHAGGWATPFAVQQMKKGLVSHPVYGWVDSSWVEHLERGELPAPGFTNPRQVRWLSAADANALRNTINRGWKIDTEHFHIETDVPLAEAIAFGRTLEAFRDLFLSLLADVIADDLPMVRRFKDKGKASPRPLPHTVYYFSTREEYVDYLRPRGVEKVEETLGFCDPPKSGKRRGVAYFFRDPGGQLDVTATLFHEVSHQLLFESTSVSTTAYQKNAGNYWVFEGLGTYFETVVTQPDGSLQVGGFVGPRIETAQLRLLDRGEFVPIDQLVRLGQKGFNDSDKIHLHYAEAMALCVFLINGHGGDYREGFLDYVRDALHGRLRGEAGRALGDRLGVPYSKINAEFLAELKPRGAVPPSR